MAVLSSVGRNLARTFDPSLGRPWFRRLEPGAEMAEKLAYIVGVRNRPDEFGRLLDALASLTNPAEAHPRRGGRPRHRRRA